MCKRILDLLIVGVLLLPASVAMLLVIAVSILSDGWPVMYSQRRIGHLDRIFRLYKLRTMSNGVDSHGNLLPDDLRITRWGRLLRTSSLDELPQLWNVLRGEMSIVGPRPLPVHYLPRYTASQGRRHAVKPGITGWAQINGRNALSWTQKSELDIWYVDHQNLSLDLKILWMTALKVIRRDGISQDGHATMPVFLREQQ